MRVRGGAQLIDAVLHSLAGDMRAAAKRLAVRPPKALRLRVGTPRDSRFERSPVPWQRAATSSAPADALPAGRQSADPAQAHLRAEYAVGEPTPAAVAAPTPTAAPAVAVLPIASAAELAAAQAEKAEHAFGAALSAAVRRCGLRAHPPASPPRAQLYWRDPALGSSAGAHARKRSGR